MTEHQASRTLLKSPPELWAECSDAQSLARHLDDFGEIRITRLEPEQAVAWEGERVSGTVRLEPSGWGTKVTLTASAVRSGPSPGPSGPAKATPPAEPVSTAPPWPFAVPTPPNPVAAPAALKLKGSEPVEAPGGPAPKHARTGFRARVWRFLLGPVPAQGPDEPPAQPDPGPALAPPPPPALNQPDPPPNVPLPPPPGPSDGPTATPPVDPKAEAALKAALESLGKAHHRPFSRP